MKKSFHLHEKAKKTRETFAVKSKKNTYSGFPMNVDH